MDFRRTEAYRPRMRRENEEVDVEEVAAVKPWNERTGRGGEGAGDALRRCLSWKTCPIRASARLLIGEVV